MTPLAITFMIIAMLVIWGGLVISLVFLARHPLPPEEGAEPAPDTTAPRARRRGRRGSDPVPGQWPGTRP